MCIYRSACERSTQFLLMKSWTLRGKLQQRCKASRHVNYFLLSQEYRGCFSMFLQQQILTSQVHETRRINFTWLALALQGRNLLNFVALMLLLLTWDIICLGSHGIWSWGFLPGLPLADSFIPLRFPLRVIGISPLIEWEMLWIEWVLWFY